MISVRAVALAKVPDWMEIGVEVDGVSVVLEVPAGGGVMLWSRLA